MKQNIETAVTRPLTKLPAGDNVREILIGIYQRLESAYGDLGWWPAETNEEMVIGAILVQNVSWNNTQRALLNLSNNGLLSLPAIHRASADQVAACIVPTRFFNMKARRLKTFAMHVMTRHDGSLERLLRQPMATLRKELLSIQGIGPETADDILLYGAKYPSFVIDAYTKRILERHQAIPQHVGYDELRDWFMTHLPNDTPLFNQFHALLDRLGNRCCLAKKPRCIECPLCDTCAFGTNHSKLMGMN